MRSLLMTLVAAVSLLCRRESLSGRTLALAALGLSAAFPGSALEISFQLSFVSVLALLAGHALRSRPALDTLRSSAALRERARHAIWLSTAALVGTLPLTAYHFNWITPIGLVTNPLLIPLSGVPATLLGLAGAAACGLSEEVAGVLFRLGGFPLALLSRVSSLAAALPFASLRVPTPTLLEIALVYAALAVPFLPRFARRGTAAAIAAALALDAGFWLRERFIDDRLRVRFLDVGQGDAAVLELPGGQVVVVDGGGFARSRFDVGERVVARYLRARKIARVDVLVASHGDWDHQGGLHYLAREFRPRELWRSDVPKEALRLAALETEVAAAGGATLALRTGDFVERAGVRFDCLHPSGSEGFEGNDASLVLRLSFGQTSMLLTGDVEQAAERALVRSSMPPTGILKVPHHGSRTSTSAALLAAVRPAFAIVSLGEGNPFAFPSESVVHRIRESGARLFRTDRDGSIWLATDGKTVAVRSTTQGSPFFCSVAAVLC